MSRDIASTLKYAKDDKTKPYYFGYPRTEEEKKEKPEHIADYGGTIVAEKVVVMDGRARKLKFDVNSFELVKQHTELSTKDFYDNQEKIRNVYYKEIIDLVKKQTGAEHAVVFNHQVRNAKLNTGSIEAGKQNLNTSIQGYADGIHTDTHVEQADSMFNMALGQLDIDEEEMKRCRSGRYLYMNCWRNISNTPIANNHLALLDQTSVVSPDDFIATDMFFTKGSHNQQYRLSNRNVKRHRWYYFSAMEKDEVIMFKQFDSNPDLSGRMCFHTAFQDPNAPADAPVRESIEIRVYAFFPNHEPNTCPPEVVSEDEDEETEEEAEKVIKKGVETMYGTFSALHTWPENGVTWLKNQVSQGEKGIRLVAKTLARDDGGLLKMKHLSSKKKSKIVDTLMSDEKFTLHVKASLEKYAKDKGQNF